MSTIPLKPTTTPLDGTRRSQDEAAIRTVIAEQVEAMKARDAEGLVARFATEVVTFNLAPPLSTSGPEAADVDRLRAWFASFDGPVDYEVRDLDVTVDQDLAVTHSLNRLSTTPRGMPAPFDLWFRVTVVLRRVDDTWKVVHEHQSTPFYMDGSFRAALDLTP